MRVFFKSRLWINAGMVCLPCLLSTGCQSTGPGSNWMSWMKPKPSSTALASTVPTKPSASSLPPPSATTSLAGTGLGTGANGASAISAPATTSNPANGYHTGPYGMAGSTPTAQSSPVYATNTPGGTAPATQTATAPYGGYQSPYQQPSAQPAGAYRTADTRKPYGTTATANAYGTQPAAAPANNWNNDQWGRSEPRGVYQPAGYSEVNTSPAAGTWNSPTASETNPGGYQDRYGAAPLSVPAATAVMTPGTAGSTAGSYRPGSTARNPGTLAPAPDANSAVPSTNAYSVPAGSSPGGAYPATSYPTTAYPATDGSAIRSAANTSVYGGGYTYPSTTQAR